MTEANKNRLSLALLLPIAIFAVVALLLLLGLMRDNPDELPSAHTLKPAPELKLADLRPDDPAPTVDDLAGEGIKLVNFWASWCGPCRVEHPTLMKLAAEGIPIYGVNYKDEPGAALGFLQELGDPYAKVGGDTSGRTGLDWGLYGVPETFVIDAEGRVLLRFPGPVTERVLRERLRPFLDQGT